MGWCCARRDPEQFNRSAGLFALFCLIVMIPFMVCSAGDSTAIRPHRKAHRHFVPTTVQDSEAVPMPRVDFDRG